MNMSWGISISRRSGESSMEWLVILFVLSPNDHDSLWIFALLWQLRHYSFIYIKGYLFIFWLIFAFAFHLYNAVTGRLMTEARVTRLHYSRYSTRPQMSPSAALSQAICPEHGLSTSLSTYTVYIHWTWMCFIFTYTMAVSYACG